MDFRNVQLPREIHSGSGIIEEIGDVPRLAFVIRATPRELI